MPHIYPNITLYTFRAQCCAVLYRIVFRQVFLSFTSVDGITVE